MKSSTATWQRPQSSASCLHDATVALQRWQPPPRGAMQEHMSLDNRVVIWTVATANGRCDWSAGLSAGPQDEVVSRCYT